MHCGKQNPEESAFCVFCGKPVARAVAETRPKKFRPPLVTVGWILGLMALLGLMMGLLTSDSPEQRADEEEQRRTQQAQEKAEAASRAVQTACRKGVKHNLVAPSTADFPHWLDHVGYLGEGKYDVQTEVDAQNVFGAKIRKTFDCEVLCGFQPSGLRRGGGPYDDSLGDCTVTKIKGLR
jgi:hypothetical protein